jgi:hypothetical protein
MNAMDMDRLDATQPAAKAILCGVCCRDPPMRDDLIALFGGGTTVPLAAFHLSSDEGAATQWINPRPYRHPAEATMAN